MTIYLYGGGAADWAMHLVEVDGTGLIPQLQPGAVITCHNAQTEGSAYQLALADGTPVDYVTAAEEGDDLYGPGHWPLFRAPVLGCWIAVNGGKRVWATSLDLPQVLQDLIAAAQGAQAAAVAAASHAAELAGSSSVAGHLAAPDPHQQYLNASRGDQRYLRGEIETAPLQEPRERIVFSSLPPAEAANLREVGAIIGGVLRLAAWDNEKGCPRREQLPGMLWENLYVAICAHNGTGRAYAVEQRGIDGIRRLVGGFDARGRVVASDQAWAPITSVDPDGTGAYAASTTLGPAPLGARWDADDLVRLQGRIDAEDVTAGDSLAVIPSGYHPQSARLVPVPTTSGELVPCELMTNGRIVARRSLAGPVTLALDDITYARVVADQDTGDWSIISAGIATPGTSSPLTVTHAGQTGRLYLLALARNTAADPFTTVTDSAGNTWTRQAYAPTSGSIGRRVELWTCQPTNPFSSVSVAFTGSGTAYASLYEITGHNAAAPVDDVAADFRNNSTLTPAPVEVTPSGTGRLVVSVLAAAPNQLGQISVSAGWTALPSNNGGPAVYYLIDPTPDAPVGPSFTLSTSAGSGAGIIAIAPA